ncbi:endolytic transglycosylase MltG [Lysobacter korlensis]|uniref:Endolytic murein transglycosylase n=1 Tax=Lysobacter korlensis TaxID=553636 RepID=A0ABV6RQ31_9GAMM
MAEQTPWDDIFSPQPSGNESSEEHPKTAVLPVTRREVRAQDRRPPLGEQLGKTPKPKRKRKWGVLIAFLVFLALLVGAGTTVWFTFEDRIRDVLGWAEPNDYEGTGNGEPVDIVIATGHIGADVAATLEDAGVTKSFDAFYDLLLTLPEQPNFLPGTYTLEQQMSAESALDALLDPANRSTWQVSFPEGVTTATILQRISEGTGLPIEELQAIAEDHESLGVPADAPSIEGYLFPATYEFDPETPARDILQRMVDRMFESLDAAGVAPEDRHRVLTVASLVQREAGTAEDFGKVARVVYNRLDTGMMLQFDSTSHYGWQVTRGEAPTGSVFTTDEERADENPYNTYAKTGLPAGPIAAPGDAAIQAALNPADGDWLFFVAVNLKTGESVFSSTLAEHNRAVDQLAAWCAESDENAEYCG